MQFIISDLFIGIVLAAVMYGVNAWSITMEDGVRQNKGILLKNKFVKRILWLPDEAKRIDRLVLALDAGWVLYVLYGLLYYHTEIFPIKISYLKIGFIFLWVELATICYIGICIQKETVHHAKHREYFDFIEKEEWMEVDQVRYRCIYTRSKKKEPLKGVIVFYPSSYSLLQSSDGYYYVLAHEAGKDVMKQMANVGAYEELSDCFVRSGYATMCMELERGENIRETIYAWLEIRATYLDEDLHPEIDEKKVFDDIDNLIKKLKYNELKVIEKNYSRFVQFSVMENHKTERTEEMISMYENITKIATGSYGLLYYLDDEDEVYSDEFRVLVSKKGKCEWKRDENFSPCSIMIDLEMVNKFYLVSLIQIGLRK